MRTIIDEMDHAALLRSRCVEVFGEDQADYHCHRIQMRAEDQAKKTIMAMASIVSELERTQHAH